ncbi:MAG: hypothetical protein K2P44_12910 [Lachnospiraceae bacterium]|nr:hypothetical protein [Lachnospiraceae bacterium]
MACRSSCRNGTALTRCFLHAVSEIPEIASAQAEAARLRKENFELA